MGLVVLTRPSREKVLFKELASTVDEADLNLDQGGLWVLRQRDRTEHELDHVVPARDLIDEPPLHVEVPRVDAPLVVPVQLNHHGLFVFQLAFHLRKLGFEGKRAAHHQNLGDPGRLRVRPHALRSHLQVALSDLASLGLARVKYPQLIE